MKQITFYFLRALFVRKSIYKIIIDKPQITGESLFDGVFSFVSLFVIKFRATDYKYKY